MEQKRLRNIGQRYHELLESFFGKISVTYCFFMLVFFTLYPLDWGVHSGESAKWMLVFSGLDSAFVTSPLFAWFLSFLRLFLTPNLAAFSLSVLSLFSVLLALLCMLFQAKGKLWPTLLILFWCALLVPKHFFSEPGPGGLWLLWVSGLGLVSRLGQKAGFFWWGLGALLEPWISCRALWIYRFSNVSLGFAFLAFSIMLSSAQGPWDIWKYFFQCEEIECLIPLPLSLLFFATLTLPLFLQLGKRRGIELMVSILSLKGPLSWGMPLETAFLWVVLPFFCVMEANKARFVTPWLRWSVVPSCFLCFWLSADKKKETDATWMLRPLPPSSVLWLQTPLIASRLEWAQMQGLRTDIRLKRFGPSQSITPQAGQWTFLEGGIESLSETGGVIPWSELSLLLPQGQEVSFESWKNLVRSWVLSPRFEEGVNAPRGSMQHARFKARLSRLDEILGLWLKFFPGQVEMYLAAAPLVEFLDQFEDAPRPSLRRHAFEVLSLLRQWFPDHRALHLALQKEASALVAAPETKALFGPVEEARLIDQFSLRDRPGRQNVSESHRPQP